MCVCVIVCHLAGTLMQSALQDVLKAHLNQRCFSYSPTRQTARLHPAHIIHIIFSLIIVNICKLFF